MAGKPTYEALLQQVRELENSLAEKDRTEKALKRRILALTQPRDSAEGLELEDLFDMEDIQRLQDDFARATGVASIITRIDGSPITQPSNFCRLCEKIIRKTEQGFANCCKSDAALGKLSADGPMIQPCMSGGLWDAGAGISVGGKHIANWLIGQVRDETQTEENMRNYAREIGVDEATMIEAFREVPSMSLETFRHIARMLFTLANQLSAMAYQNVQQVRFIADLKRAEEALKESEARLQTLIRTLPDLIWLKDPQSVYLSCNPRFEAHFGAREKDIVGKTDYDFLSKKRAESYRREDRQVLDEGRPIRNESEFIFASDGHREILETIKTPMYRSDGRLIGVLGIGRDTTDRKRAEQKLQRSRVRYQALYQESLKRTRLYESLLESVPIALVIYNLDGQATYVNPAFTSTFGFTMQDVKGRRIPFVPEEEKEKSLAGIQQVLNGEPVFSLSTRRLTKDGRILDILLSSSCYDDDTGNRAGIVVFLRDVTQVKQTEAQLLQAQKMESVGRLAGGVAHDFNNMLSVILGYTELEMAQLDESQPLYNSLKEIRRAATRSANLTRQLLAFARKQTVTPKVLDLNRTLEGMLKMLRRLLGEDIDLVWRPTENIWPVKLDASQVDQLLTNLCVNARDAIRDVGRITIETGKKILDEAYCSQNQGFVPGEYVMLTVSDDGCGMPRETRDKIFEPFFTTKGSRQGTGLGLSTVYGIVKQNNGFINVYSEPGHGTTFRIYLPSYLGQAAENIKQDAQTVPHGNGEVVLIVEDEPLILNLAERMLQNIGYTVLSADSPKKALQLAKAHIGDVTLVVTDVVMPELNGQELAARLKGLYPDIKCLFMSGYTANVIAHHGVLDEGVNFIQKPFTTSELALKVNEALAIK